MEMTVKISQANGNSNTIVDMSKKSHEVFWNSAYTTCLGKGSSFGQSQSDRTVDLMGRKVLKK
jgi:hypothetical protein